MISQHPASIVCPRCNEALSRKDDDIGVTIYRCQCGLITRRYPKPLSRRPTIRRGNHSPDVA